MEDCKVSFDMSVRNASGVIIQYLYGEDGMDAIKLETQQIPTIDMDMDKVRAMYGLVDGIEDFKSVVTEDVYADLEEREEQFIKLMDEHHRQVVEDREHMIMKVNRGKKEDTVVYPVSLYRIINNVVQMNAKFGCDRSMDLSPYYVLMKLNKLCGELTVSKTYKQGTRIFQVLLRSYLSPKRAIFMYKLNQKSFEMIVEQIKFRFFEALAHPNDMVGVVAAQSIGEPATQLVLNTFHASGISSASKAVRGVPRLNELLAVSKNIKTPVMTIYLNESVHQDSKKCIDIMNNIRTIRFKDIVMSSKIYFDPNDFAIDDDRAFVELYRAFVNFPQPAEKHASPWLLRLEFDRVKMLDFGLDMISLHNVLANFYDETITCVFPDDNAKQLIMRIKITKEKGDMASDDMLTELKALEHNILENVVIKGVKNVERVAIEEKTTTMYNPQMEKFNAVKEWVIYTDGTNLKDVLALPVVDAPRTITNDVNEIYEYLGIEAARQALYDEIVAVMDSISINYRHIALLVDVMTNKGTILSVNRHGINRGDIGPLAKCSFEETTDKLIKAGIFAEHDRINGVSANVMLGQIAPCGTGNVDVVMDEYLISKMNEVIDDEILDEMEPETACAPDNLRNNMDVYLNSNQAIAQKDDNEIVFV
jgi:DNA-directed RNA polymerase II subunit RPB1